MKYRKKPVIIEAEQWFPHREMTGVYYDEGRAYVVTAHAQRVYLEPGDWVIPEPDGRGHYPCKPDIFAATYEAAESADELKTAGVQT